MRKPGSAKTAYTKAQYIEAPHNYIDMVNNVHLCMYTSAAHRDYLASDRTHGVVFMGNT